MNVDRSKSISIRPGSLVDFENNQAQALVARFELADSTELEIELAPGQRVRLKVGKTSPKVFLLDGSPGGLRLVDRE